MNDTLDELKQQHLNNYKKAIIELVKNNTNVLIDDDINSLFCKPPLDSMDVIKTKFLELAKKNSIILNTEELTKIVDNYRSCLVKWSIGLKDERLTPLISIVDDYKPQTELELIKINKKDFTNINKKLKKMVKDKLKDESNKKIVNNVNLLFTNNADAEIKEKILDEIKKFLNGKYQRQLLENIDFKVLVKDTTLINLVKEQGERYLFTKQNSHIFKEI